MFHAETRHPLKANLPVDVPIFDSHKARFNGSGSST